MEKKDILAEKFVFYENYHKNILNKLVHLICIPLLTWTTTVFLGYIPIFNVFNHQIRMDVFVTILYMLYYIYLDLNLGLVSSLVLYFNLKLASSYVQSYPFNSGFKFVFILHILSWISQILSHKYFEGNRPAFLKGLFDSFTVAPLFSFLEFLFIFNLGENIYNRIENYKKKN